MSHITKIREFIIRYIPEDHLKEDDDIFASGFVSSLFAMELVLFIEKEFEIHIDNEDLDLDNFKTLESIYKLINHKLKLKEKK